jgi:hypothetical protein
MRHSPHKCRHVINDQDHAPSSVVTMDSAGKPLRPTNLLVKVNGEAPQRPIGREQWVWVHRCQGSVGRPSCVVDAHSSVVGGHSVVVPGSGPLSQDKCLMVTGKCLLSTDRTLESVAASPLSADQGRVSRCHPPRHELHAHE